MNDGHPIGPGASPGSGRHKRRELGYFASPCPLHGKPSPPKGLGYPENTSQTLVRRIGPNQALPFSLGKSPLPQPTRFVHFYLSSPYSRFAGSVIRRRQTLVSALL